MQCSIVVRGVKEWRSGGNEKKIWWRGAAGNIPFPPLSTRFAVLYCLKGTPNEYIEQFTDTQYRHKRIHRL